jgi:hypothetical protein
VTEGLKNIRSKENGLRHYPLPLPCPVALRGVAVREYRRSVRRTRGLNIRKGNTKTFS